MKALVKGTTILALTPDMVQDNEFQWVDVPDDATKWEAYQDGTKAQEVFTLPVVAPDFIVQSPKPKDDPKEARIEAISESKKKDKSIAAIVLNMVKYVDELEGRIEALETDLKSRKNK